VERLRGQLEAEVREGKKMCAGVTKRSPLPPGEGQGEGTKHRPSTKRARHLRQAQTTAEKLFWHGVKAKRFESYKFRRQFPIGDYFVDFACVSAKLVVEIDGGQHCDSVADVKRTEYIERKGYKVIRFWNDEILRNIEGVLTSLSLTLSRREREFQSNGE
jgi:very-short-patch-repair endonuclease